MVTCLLCGKDFRTISNTHTRSAHGMPLKEYISRFPGHPTRCEETQQLVSQSMLGKNLGRPRPDARERMMRNNPMRVPEHAKAMSKTRSRKIAEGTIQALKNLGHLPTPKETTLQGIFHELGIPLTYVGDGQKWINGHCPDFINEERQIVLELDLDKWYHPREKAMLENVYLEAGWRCITLTNLDPDHVRQWVSPFFAPLKWEKVNAVEMVPGAVKVYNYHIVPNESFFANRILTHNCFADYFRHSLYTGFFDNSKTMGLRHGDPERYKQELAPLLAHRGEPVSGENDIINAFRLGIPLRFGIRFEDFTAREKQIGLSLSVLEYLCDAGYPVMINTKSDLPGEGRYLEALARNKGKAAIHFTLISSDEAWLKKVEPGAPTFKRRLEAAKKLVDAGVRVVARIEPWMAFLNDDKPMVDDYIAQIKAAGIRHLTLDSYSYSAKGKGLAENFNRMGMDFSRMFLLSADSQGLSSLLLGKFMEYLRSHGLHCSTFDQGNVPANEDWICCSVGDWFEGFNWGSGVIAVKYVKEAGGKVVRWSDFDRFVTSKGGWLSSKLKHEVKMLWNGDGDAAWYLSWAAGLLPAGSDEDGLMWRWDAKDDFRLTLMNDLQRGT